MPRKNLIKTNEFHYHITSRSNNKEWFHLPIYQVWDYSLQSMELAYNKHKVEICAFVLMKNHYHLLLKTPELNIDKFMYEFNKQLSKKIRKTSNRINHVFGGRYRWSIIDNEKYFYQVLKYIYLNPVKCGEVSSAETYPYSTLFIIWNNKNFVVPLTHDYTKFMDSNDITTFINWINQNFEKKNHYETIKKGLKHSIFTISQLRESSERKNFSHY
ncbi:MAG: transposase [Oligoflexia bacterium]|nr:transposase [Oligoflexia bacterium]